MWRKIANWYLDVENEQLAVLEQPSLAAQVPAGFRRFVAAKLARLSLIERQQLREFTLAYRGRNLFIALAKLCLIFTLGGVLLHLALPKIGLAEAIIIANVFGFMLVVDLIHVWFNYRRIVKHKYRVLAWIALVMVACIGIGVASAMLSGRSLQAALEKVLPAMGLGVVAAGLLIGVPDILISITRNRQYEALTAQLHHEAERERLARELSESQLRLLRAQIEPHFLFNTLGAVQQLAERGAPRAAELTGNLIAFLRASFAEMRSEQVSLEAEFGLVEAYLRVMQMRMGARLAFTLNLPPALYAVRVPSMILLTLAENAIKHGIEPSLRGGEVSVSAAALDGAIRIRVQDSGVGMAATPGAGTGLENVRHRLQLSYGDAASLALHDADPGVIADITIQNQPEQA